MKLKQLVESVSHLDPAVQEAIIREAPHAPVGKVPEELYPLNLGNYVDFGFEDLAANQEEFTILARAIASDGIRFPGTKLKIRATPMVKAAVETADGTEVELPANWQEFVQVMDFTKGDQDLQWFGKSVRPDRRPSDEVVAAEFTPDGAGFKRA